MRFDRFSAGARVIVVVGLAVGLTLLAGSARAGTFRGDNGLIAYTCATGICTLNPDGSRAGSPLIPTAGAKSPAWSPDGRRIAVEVAGGIQVDGADGSLGPVIAGAGATQPSWSDDFDDQIAYLQGGDVFRIDSGGTDATKVVDHTVTGQTIRSPSWSPDGLEIAYSSNGAGSGTDFDIYTVNAFNPGQPLQFHLAAKLDDDAPSWSPDSRTIVFSAGGQLYTVASSGGTPALLGTGVTGTNPAYSPDGSKIVFQTAAGLSTVNADGSNLQTLGAAAGGTDPDWEALSTSPTGSCGANGQNAPVNCTYPAITLPFGKTVPTVGDFLFADTGTWDGSFPITFFYQWKKCTSPTGPCFDIPDQTSSFFTPTFDVYGWSLRVQVTAHNDDGTTGQNSEATPLVTAEVVRLRSTPQISGQNMVGQILSVDNGVWDGSPPLTYAYEWRKCNPAGDVDSCVPIPGTNTSTYTPVIDDIGSTIRAFVSAANPATSDVAVSNHTFPIVDVPHFAPSTTTPPSVTGKARVGSRLVADNGSWGGDTPIATKMVWQRCDATGQACKTIVRATKSTYAVVPADLASTIRIQVSALNKYGNAVAQSDPTDTIQAAPRHLKGRRLVGTAKADYLAGTGRDDVIIGGRGNDTLLGGAGYDSIDGGPGNDIITGGTEADKLNGGAGSDTIQAADGDPDVIDCGPGNDRAVVDDEDKVKNCEVVQTVSGGNNGTSGPGGGTIPSPSPPPPPSPGGNPGGSNGDNNDNND